MSLSGVVANLDETPSSQERAFWREMPGAAEIKSDPTATDAYALDGWSQPITDFITAVRFSIAEEAIAPSPSDIFLQSFFFRVFGEDIYVFTEIGES